MLYKVPKGYLVPMKLQMQHLFENPSCCGSISLGYKYKPMNSMALCSSAVFASTGMGTGQKRFQDRIRSLYHYYQEQLHVIEEIVKAMQSSPSKQIAKTKSTILIKVRAKGKATSLPLGHEASCRLWKIG